MSLCVVLKRESGGVWSGLWKMGDWRRKSSVLKSQVVLEFIDGGKVLGNGERSL